MAMTEHIDFIPIARPTLGNEEVEAAGRAILSGWVSQGPEVAAFEQEFAEMVGTKYACAVSSCTSALHLALLAVAVQPGDEVITVSHSFIATANAIRYCDAVPVFVDIDKKTYNIDPAKVEAAISKKTRAILCVHQLGMPCDLKRILEISRRHGLPLIEDAACAIGSEVCLDGDWEKVGRPHGDIACFSFHPRKVITTGDGGMLTTNSNKYNEQFRLVRQHSMSIPDTVRHKSNEVIFESYPALGFNYRMSDIQAAVGREQLRRLPGIIRERRKLAGRYQEILADFPGIHLPEEPEWAKSNWQSYCIRLSDGFDQLKVMQAMLDGGIATRRGVMCIHREKSYVGNLKNDSNGQQLWACRMLGSLHNSELCQDNGIILPLFPEMTMKQQDRVVNVLKTTLFS